MHRTMRVTEADSGTLGSLQRSTCRCPAAKITTAGPRVSRFLESSRVNAMSKAISMIEVMALLFRQEQTVDDDAMIFCLESIGRPYKDEKSVVIDIESALAIFTEHLASIEERADSVAMVVNELDAKLIGYSHPMAHDRTFTTTLVCSSWASRMTKDSKLLG